MLAMNGHPFLGVNARPEPQLHSHRKRHHRVQIHAAVRQCAMQIDACGKCRELHNYYDSQYGIQKMQQSRLILFASSVKCEQTSIECRTLPVKRIPYETFHKVRLKWIRSSAASV